MGGADKVKRQRDQGRLNVRERIDRILDRASFHEIGAVSGIGEYNDKGELTTLTPANCVFGRGKVKSLSAVNTNVTPFRETPAPLYESDHGGVVAKLRVR